jgi:acetyltransferase-like isoleucine patch superfamily enzyme
MEDINSGILAPIVLFVFDRPQHTLKTLEALSKNIYAKDSNLYVFCDGPKINASLTQLANIDEVYAIVNSKPWCKNVKIIKRKDNLGLANSIISGISQIVKKYGKVIVLEDDIVTTTGFLKFMNEALLKYQDNEKVMQVSGYIYPANINKEQSTVFLRILSCWGWGTWDTAWQHYNHDVDYLINRISTNKKVIKRFNINGDADFYKQLLNNQNSTIYTWAVRWYASWFLKDGLCLYPTKSLVENIGHDGTGIHCTATERYKNEVVNELTVDTIALKEDKKLKSEVNEFYKQHYNASKVSLLQHAKQIINRHIRVRLRKLLFFNNPLLSYNNYVVNSEISNSCKLYTPHEIRNCKIDQYSYISKNAELSHVTIGKFCSIGPNIVAGWGIHPTNGISSAPCFYSKGRQNGITFVQNSSFIERIPITIGHDVFIGANVTILDGVVIGNGAIIGAGAVVSKNIPAYAIAVGSPIKILKYRFNQEQIEQLQTLKWWDWPIEKLKDIPNQLFDIDAFLQKHIKL